MIEMIFEFSLKWSHEAMAKWGMGSMKAYIFKRLICICVLSNIIFNNTAFAQTLATESNFKSKLATVIFVGLGGAVLGLSTLSFYGEPEEHISNITTGFALGILAGTSYVIYDSAAASSSSLSWIDELKSIENKNNSQMMIGKSKPMQLSWAWNY